MHFSHGNLAVGITSPPRTPNEVTKNTIQEFLHREKEERMSHFERVKKGSIFLPPILQVMYRTQF